MSPHLPLSMCTYKGKQDRRQEDAEAPLNFSWILNGRGCGQGTRKCLLSPPPLQKFLQPWEAWWLAVFKVYILELGSPSC